MTDTDQDVGVADDDPLFGGDTARIRDTVTDEDGTAVDLASASSVEFAIFADEFGGTTELTASDSDTEFSTAGTNDEVAVIELSPSQTQDLAPSNGTAFYDWRLRVTDVTGDTDTVTTGTFAVHAG